MRDLEEVITRVPVHNKPAEWDKQWVAQDPLKYLIVLGKMQKVSYFISLPTNLLKISRSRDPR